MLEVDPYAKLHWVDSKSIQFIKNFGGPEDELAYLMHSALDTVSQEPDGADRDYIACHLGFIAGYYHDYDGLKRALRLVTDDLFRAEAFLFVALSQVLAVENRQQDLHHLIWMAIDLIAENYCLPPWMAEEAWSIYVEKEMFREAEELLVYL